MNQYKVTWIDERGGICPDTKKHFPREFDVIFSADSEEEAKILAVQKFNAVLPKVEKI